MDPIIHNSIVATIAVVFLVGAIQKLRDPMAFEIAIDAYELLPQWLVRPFSYALPLVEFGAALLLIFPTTRSLGVITAIGLLVVVTSAVAINLVRGNTDVGCGCGGIEDEQLLSWGLVARNAVLVGVTATLLMELALRPTYWFDYLVTALATIAGYALYVIASQLIANWPRLITIRGNS